MHIIRALFDGGYVTHHGTHFDVENAKLWDLPEQRVPIGIAVSGERSCELMRHPGRSGHRDRAQGGPPERVRPARGTGKPRVGQVPVCYDTDRDAAIARAHDQFRWSLGGWKVNSELPGPSAFDQATAFVRKDDITGSIPCGSDVDAFVEAVRPYREAGFTEVALVQIGGAHQRPFIEWAGSTLLPALREL